MGIHYHVCKVCGEEKPFSNMQATTCKDCQDAGYKYCTACGKIKSVAEFSWNKANCNYRAECKKCYSRRGCADEKIKYQIDDEYHKKRNTNSTRSKAKRFQESELVRQKVYTYHHNYNARKLFNGGMHTTEEWLDCLESFDNKCAYCGATHNLTRDHIVPLISGGYNYIFNIVPACSSCNSSKSGRDVVEWFTSRAYYSVDRLQAIHAWYRLKQAELLGK